MPCLQDGYDHSKQSNGTAENFNNEDLDKEAGILSISEGSSTAHNANTDATEEVWKANSESSTKHGETWKTAQMCHPVALQRLRKIFQVKSQNLPAR